MLPGAQKRSEILIIQFIDDARSKETRSPQPGRRKSTRAAELGRSKLQRVRGVSGGGGGSGAGVQCATARQCVRALRYCAVTCACEYVLLTTTSAELRFFVVWHLTMALK
jgi:hypothetical protein